MAIKLVEPPVHRAPTPVDRAPPPPRELGEHGLALWRRIHAGYAIEDEGGLELLCLASEALDRAQSLRDAIMRDGELIRTKTGLRDNPLLRHELANRSFVARSLQRLGLDVEPVRGMGRPSGGG